MTVIAIAVGAFGTSSKGLVTGLAEIEIEGKPRPSKLSALLWSARMLRKVLETKRDLLLLRLQ